MPHIFIFGFGFTARALADVLDPSEYQISATSRSPEGAAEITAFGAQGFVFSDERQPSADLKQAVSSATHILSSVPPGTMNDPVLAALADTISDADDLQWLGYLSTIGVYGDHQGQWVDEATPAAPQSQRSKRRLSAERAWQQAAQKKGAPLSIFRLAGIYGPGRSAIDRVRAGAARCIIKPDQVFNRIHVGDAARIITASLDRPQNDGIYNLTDDLPAPPQDVIAYAAKIMDAPPPPHVAFEDANLSAMAKSFYSENKRVRNQRIKDDLGVTLQFPTYKQGLEAIINLSHAALKER